MGRIIITKDNCKIERTDVYLVRLTMSDGQVFENLEPRRLFPLTDLEHYITFMDSNEKEIALLNDMANLDSESADAVKSCFEDFYMIPKISEVISIQDKYGTLKWVVRTDRGVIEFRIRNRHSDIKCLRGSDRVLIRDSNDNRYEIPNFSALDKHSRRLLFSYT